jgi:MazG family protein
MHTREEQMQAFGRLLDIMDELREKCPWDHVQTNESLRQNTIEEVFELGDALLKDNKSDICKELGDILLHIVFYAKIGSETGDFDIKDVCDKLCDKLIFRHPHVFGSANVDGQEQVLQNWEQLKLKEKGGNKRVLAGVPDALPSIIKAFRIQEKVAHVGFDWRDPQGALEKVLEEYDELIAEIKAGDKEKSEAELGDLLFSIINLARLYDIHPDNALERTNRKFIDRFNYMEESAIRQGRQLKEMSLEELDSLWNEGYIMIQRVVKC